MPDGIVEVRSLFVKPEVYFGPDGFLHLDEAERETPVGGIAFTAKCGVPLLTIGQVLEREVTEKCGQRGNFCSWCRALGHMWKSSGLWWHIE